MATYYVDATAGSDNNTGLSANTAFQSLAKLQSVLADGDVICLQRGDTWHESLNILYDNITVQGYGTGANPLIDGDNVRTCIWVAGSGVTIDNIDGSEGSAGVLIQGVGASASVIGGTYDQCGVGIGVGGGGTLGLGVNGHGLGPAVYGQLILADGVTVTNSTNSLAAGDGIQIGEDATDTTHTIRNCVLDGNDTTGINAKSGIVIVENCTMTDNGWSGYTAQNNLDELHISGSLIEGNGTAGNGTAQVSLEDHAKVYSTNNVYKDPYNDDVNYTLQIRMVAQDPPTSWYQQGAELHSSYDSFINLTGQTQTLGSIGAYTTNHTGFVVDIRNATFQHAADGGIAVDAYGSTALQLSIQNSVFDMADTRAIRVHSAALGAAQLDYNSYYRADGGTVIEVQDRYYFALDQLDDLYAQFGLEQHGQALASSPDISIPPDDVSTPPPGNPAPTSLSLSGGAVTEGVAGAIAGTLTAPAPVGDDSYSFSVSDPRFAVVASAGAYRLKLLDGVSLDYESEANVALTVVADCGGVSYSANCTVAVANVTGATIKGSGSSDFIGAESGAPGQLLATSEEDTIYGAGGGDTIYGLAGCDTIFGGRGDDSLFGEAGDDTLLGTGGVDSLSGGDGDDILYLSGSCDARDGLDGGSGLDTLAVNGTGKLTLAGFDAAASSIESWQGNGESVSGTGADERFDFGGLSTVSGLPSVEAGGGDDVLIGSRFDDDLRGGLGNDRIAGGAGADLLTGGGGNDTFVFAAGSGHDTVRDFALRGRSTDTIEIAKDIFSEYAQLAAASRQVGADVVITTGAADSITLADVSLAKLSADDFRFV